MKLIIALAAAFLIVAATIQALPVQPAAWNHVNQRSELETDKRYVISDDQPIIVTRAFEDAQQVARSSDIVRRAGFGALGKAADDLAGEGSHIFTYGAKKADIPVVKQLHADATPGKWGVEATRGAHVPYRSNRALPVDRNAMDALLRGEGVSYVHGTHSLEVKGKGVHGSSSGSSSPLKQLELGDRNALALEQLGKNPAAHRAVDMDPRLAQELKDLNLKGIGGDKLKNVLDHAPVHRQPGQGLNRLDRVNGHVKVNKDMDREGRTEFPEKKGAEMPKKKKKSFMSNLLRIVGGGSKSSGSGSGTKRIEGGSSSGSK